MSGVPLNPQVPMGWAQKCYPQQGATFSGKRKLSKPANINNVGTSEAPVQKHVPAVKQEPLKSAHSIRLLTLHPASDKDDPISCTLTVHDFDKAIPRFTALSYTWGSLENPKTIQANGFPATITSNLHVALTHLRSTKRRLDFWIDALCINQNSKHERNRQVPLMRDIYMVAEGVIAFLGPATPGLDLDNKVDVFLDIASRPYWNRLWIIQEFVLGKNVKLQCGHTLYDWNSFCNESPKEVWKDGKQMRRLFDLKRHYKGRNQSLSVAEIIGFAIPSQVTDPRDRIYGVLGLATIPGKDGALRADHDLSACQIYQQVTYSMTLPKDWSPFSIPENGTAQKKGPRQYHVPKRCDGQKCGSLRDMHLTVGKAMRKNGHVLQI